MFKVFCILREIQCKGKVTLQDSKKLERLGIFITPIISEKDISEGKVTFSNLIDKLPEIEVENNGF